ncbi:PIN domain-containing protein [Candidatus Woesearchaeota archaeon]|nr:PIN domain-containing protein [Candidatus Woesearchaeota archaeon]
MKFLDSNILAYAFYENEFQENSRNVIRQGGFVDTLCLIEAFNIIEMQTSREIAVQSIRGLLRSNLVMIDVGINVVFEALKKSPRFKKLKFLDLIHYTVALLNNCESIVSYDSDFDQLEITRTEN